MEPRREGSLGARGSTELRPDDTLVESFSATQREDPRAGFWSPLLATMTEILALSLTIITSVGSEITCCKNAMKLQSGEHMFMMSMSECEISSNWNTVVQNRLLCLVL
jgi:hypothetical protein